jgi:ketosteroid isomerase-like protein
MMAVGSLLVSTSALAQSTDAHAKDRAYIQQAESDWAESVATKDVTVIERILADDYVGVDVDGQHYSKADLIKWYARPPEYISNHMNGVEIRFYGETAVAQGSESWKKKDGTTGEFVWTDT